MSYRRKTWSTDHLSLISGESERDMQRSWKNTGFIIMGDIARCSIGKENELYNEDLLYKLLGVNAELPTNIMPGDMHPVPWK